MKIAIIGRTKTLLNNAKRLLENNHEIALCITCKEAPEYTVTNKDFEQFSLSNNIPFIYTSKINTSNIIERILSVGEIDIGISMNFVNIIQQKVIDLFPLGILNVHAGDLPKYRGNAPIAWALLNKEEKIGLCVHKMIGGELDSGDIIAKTFFSVSLKTKIEEVFQWVELTTPELVILAVNQLSNNPDYFLEKQSKDPMDILRCYPRLPQDGKINWSSDAEDIIRLINVSGKPFSGAFTFLEGEKIIIEDAELFHDDEPWLGIPGQIVKVNANGSIIALTGSRKIQVNQIRLSITEKAFPPSKKIKSVRKRFE